MSSLPMKRSPPNSPVPSSAAKKSKAELKRQSLSRAHEWAANNKRKKEGIASDDDDAKKHKVDADDADEDIDANEVGDVLENLPPARPRRARRSADDASAASNVSTSSTGSRRSSRRRTMEATAATTAALAAATTVKKGRKKSAAASTPDEDEKKETPKSEAKEGTRGRMGKLSPDEVQATVGGDDAKPMQLKLTSYLPQLSVFLHALLLQWTLAFAITLTFCLDWFMFEFCPEGACTGYSNQRASSAILGLWLVTIVGYSIALGTNNIAGWILTTAALAMSSFSAKAIRWGDANDVYVSVASVPIYSVASLEINVPDLLVLIGLVGCTVLLATPASTSESLVDNGKSQGGGASDVDEKPAENKEKATAEREQSGPRSLIGQRVAVENGSATSYGTVKDYDPETRLWLISYDNEYEEEDELNRIDLASAFKLYSKDLADNLKAMWRSGEI
eukprot:g9928.t1 g9928   contig4:897767-899305(+)